MNVLIFVMLNNATCNLKAIRGHIKLTYNQIKIFLFNLTLSLQSISSLINMIKTHLQEHLHLSYNCIQHMINYKNFNFCIHYFILIINLFWFSFMRMNIIPKFLFWHWIWKICIFWKWEHIFLKFFFFLKYIYNF